MALLMAVSIFVSACGPLTSIDRGAPPASTGITGSALPGSSGSGGSPPDVPELTCDDVTLGKPSALPTHTVSVSAIPSHFGETPALLFTDPVNSGNSHAVPVDGSPGATDATFIVPLHPNGTAGGGPVHVSLIDGDNEPCPEIDFVIEPLPPAPGAFAEMVRLLKAIHSQVGHIIEGDAAGGGPVDIAHEVAGELISGRNNKNSLDKIVNNEAPATADTVTEIWDVVDALIGESGINGELSNLSEAVAGIGTPEGRGGTGHEPPARPAMCIDAWFQPDAARLAWMMERHTEVTDKRESTGYVVDAFASLAMTIGVINLGATKLVPNPYTAVGAGVSGAVAAGLTSGQLLADMVKNTLFPAAFVDMTFSYDKPLFWEDDEPPAGRWYDVRVTAQSEGMDMDSAVGNYILKKMGGKAGRKVLDKHWGKAGVAEAAGFINGTFSKTAMDAAIGKGADREGFLHLPPCPFGPVELDESFYYIAEFDPFDGPAEVTGDGEFRIYHVGYADLLLQVDPNRFGGKHISSRGPVEIVPIQVKVSPERAHGEPGFATEFTIRVENANDTSIAFNIEPEGDHIITDTRRISRDTYAITVATSPEAEHFPALLTVTSLSDRGLRGEPDAPVRSGSAILSSGATMEITPGTACLEWGETLQFEAEVRGYPDSAIHWSTVGGRISPSGLLTAPREDTQIEVTATSAADGRVWATALVTVAEECRCWASLSLPGAGIRDVSTYGTITFRDGGDEGPGSIGEMSFSLGDLGSVKVQFNEEAPRNPELPDIFEGKNGGSFIFYDVQTRTKGNVTFMSYYAIPKSANPGGRWGLSWSFPDHSVLLDQGPSPGQTGSFNVGLRHVRSNYPLPHVTTVSGGYNVTAYPTGSPNAFTEGSGGRTSDQKLATVVRPLWKDAFSGYVYDYHQLEFFQGRRPVLPELIVPELTLELEQFEPTDEPGQYRLKGTVTGTAAVTYWPSWEADPDDVTIYIEPLHMDFQGVFTPGSEFEIPHPDPNAWVCIMPSGNRAP